MPNKKIILGLTGDIASGKSACEKIFTELNIPVINADDIVRQLLKPNSEQYQKILTYFNNNSKYPDILLPNSEHINKKLMREIIFSDNTAKEFLESILHPEVNNQLKQFTIQQNKINNPNNTSNILCVLSIPLLNKHNISNYNYLDNILYITISKNIQLQRLIKRDNITLDLAKKMLKSQPNKQDKLAIANAVINNNLDLNNLREKIIKFIKY